MNLDRYTKIKNAPGLSRSSITHKGNETGIRDIYVYATHIERAAKYVKAMKYIGYVGDECYTAAFPVHNHQNTKSQPLTPIRKHFAELCHLPTCHS